MNPRNTPFPDKEIELTSINLTNTVSSTIPEEKNLHKASLSRFTKLLSEWRVFSKEKIKTAIEKENLAKCKFFLGPAFHFVTERYQNTQALARNTAQTYLNDIHKKLKKINCKGELASTLYNEAEQYFKTFHQNQKKAKEQYQHKIEKRKEAYRQFAKRYLADDENAKELSHLLTEIPQETVIEMIIEYQLTVSPLRYPELTQATPIWESINTIKINRHRFTDLLKEHANQSDYLLLINAAKKISVALKKLDTPEQLNTELELSTYYAQPLSFPELQQVLASLQCTTLLQVNLQTQLQRYIAKNDATHWYPWLTSFLQSEENQLKVRQKLMYLIGCLGLAIEAQRDEAILSEKQSVSSGYGTFGDYSSLRMNDKTLKKSSPGIPFVLSQLQEHVSLEMDLKKQLKSVIEKSTYLNADLENIPSLSSTITANASPEEAYWQYIKYYQNPTVSSEGLYRACYELMIRANAGSQLAKFLIPTPVENLSLQGVQKAAKNEYIKKLKSIPEYSPHYQEAQLALFIVYARAHVDTVYEDCTIRLKEIYHALTHLDAVAPKTVSLDRQDLLPTAWQILISELNGEFVLDALWSDMLNKGKAKKIEVTYPFRRMSVRQLKKFLTQVTLPPPKKLIKNIQQNYAANLTDVYCNTDSAGQYRLTTDTRIFSHTSSAVICFIDKKSKLEIARLHYQKGRLAVKAYGDSIHLTLSGVLSVSHIIVDNLKGKMTLCMQVETEQALSFSAEAQRLSYHGKLQSDQSIIFDIVGEGYFGERSHIHAPTLWIRAQSAKLEKGALCVAENQLQLMAANEVYLSKGSGLIATDLKIVSPIVKNHSATVAAQTALIHAEDYLQNTATAIIHTHQKLILSGGSVYNHGKIQFGQELKTHLNKLFLLGSPHSSQLDRIKQHGITGITLASLEGEQATIVTGIFINALGQMAVRTHLLTAIAEVDMGLSQSISNYKSRLIALTMGIDVPNAKKIFEDMNKLIRWLRENQYASVLRLIFSWQTVTRLPFAGRWFIRNFLPEVGKPIDAVWTSILLLMSSNQLVKECKALYRLYQAGEKIEPRHVYPLLARAGQVANQAIYINIQLDTLMDKMNSWNEIKEYVSHLQFFMPPDLTEVVTLNLLPLFFPVATKDALVEARVGGIQAHATLQHHIGLLYEKLHTRFAFNISDTFYSAWQQNGLTVANQVGDVGRSLHQSGAIIANMVYTNVVDQVQAGEVYAKRIFWQARHFQSGITAHHHANQLQITADQLIDHQGQMQADERLSMVANHVKTGSESQLESAAVIISAEVDATLAGTVEANISSISSQGQLAIAGKMRTNEISAQAKDQLIYSGEVISKASIAMQANTLTMANESQLESATVSLVAGEQAQLAGTIKAEMAYAKTAGNMTSEAMIDAQNVYHAVNDTLEYAGDAKASDTMVMHAHTLVTHPNSRMKSTNVSLSTQEHATLSGDIISDAAYAKAGGNLKQNGVMQAKKIYHEAKVLLEENGHLTGHDMIVMEANTVVVNEASYIEGAALALSAKDRAMIAGTWVAEVDVATQASNTNTTLPVIPSLFLHAKNQLDLSDSTHITAKSGILSLQAPVGSLKGQIDTKAMYIKFDHLADVEDLLLAAGAYKNIILRDSVSIVIQDPLHFTQPIDVSYSVFLTGTHINLDKDFHSLQNIALESTVEDVLTSTSTIRADRRLSIFAKQHYRNMRSLVSADELFVHTETGHIFNVVGTLKGDTYLQLVSNQGNIENRYAEQSVQGEWDIVRVYEPAMINGGTGQGSVYSGTGLLCQAGGQFINDASVVLSVGSNYINATKGSENNAHWHVYRSYYRLWKHLYGDRETNCYSTQIQHPLIQSLAGENTLVSPEGGIAALSTNFIAPQAQKFAAKEDVQLLGIISIDNNCFKDNEFFLSPSYEIIGGEVALPTVVQSLGEITLISLQDVKILNALIVTPSKVIIHGHHVELSAPILNHWYDSLSNHLSLSFPGFDGMNGIPLIQDYQNLSHSNGQAEWMANSWNMFMDGLNSANGIVSGLRNHAWSQSLFSASFVPVVSIGLTQTQTELHWQTAATNTGIQAGDLEIKAEDSVSFTQSVPIYVAHNANIWAKLFEQSGANLESSTTIDSVTLSANLPAAGRPDMGISASHTSSESTMYSQQTCEVGGTLDVQVNDWLMNDAITDAGSLTGHANHLSLITHANTSTTNNSNESASTNFTVGYQQNHQESVLIDTPTLLETKGENDLSVGELDLEGGKVLTLGQDHFTAERVEANSVDQYNRSCSGGITGNIQQVRDAIYPPQWEQAIPSVGVQYGKTDYRATQMSTVWDASGQAPSVGSVQGELNTQNASGLVVRANEQHHYQLNVPLYHQGAMDQFRDNFNWTENQLNTLLHPASGTPEAVREDKNDSRGHSKDQQEERKKETAEEKAFGDKVEKTLGKVEDVLEEDINISANRYTLFGKGQGPIIEHDGIRNRNDNSLSERKGTGQNRQSHSPSATARILTDIRAHESMGEKYDFMQNAGFVEKALIFGVKAAIVYETAELSGAARLGIGIWKAASKLTGLFKDGVSKEEGVGEDDVANMAATSHISSLRLQRQLASEEQQSLFNATGGLSAEAIKSSRLIIPADDLGNKKLLNELSNRPGNLSDWGKYVTDLMHTPSGKVQIHFYYNPVTRDVYYGRDYKSIFDHQGTSNVQLTRKFDYEPPRFK